MSMSDAKDLPDTRPYPDNFERTSKDGTVIKFKRSIGVPNENFWNVYIGSKSIGYFCLPPYSKRWGAHIHIADIKRNNYFETSDEALLNIVETIGWIMG